MAFLDKSLPQNGTKKSGKTHYGRDSATTLTTTTLTMNVVMLSVIMVSVVAPHKPLALAMFDANKFAL